MYTLFDIAHGKALTAPLPQAPPTDPTIRPTPEFILAKDVWELYRLSLSEIAVKQIKIGLRINPS